MCPTKCVPREKAHDDLLNSLGAYDHLQISIESLFCFHVTDCGKKYENVFQIHLTEYMLDAQDNYGQKLGCVSRSQKKRNKKSQTCGGCSYAVGPEAAVTCQTAYFGRQLRKREVVYVVFFFKRYF